MYCTTINQHTHTGLLSINVYWTTINQHTHTELLSINALNTLSYTEVLLLQAKQGSESSPIEILTWMTMTITSMNTFEMLALAVLLLPGYTKVSMRTQLPMLVTIGLSFHGRHLQKQL